MRTSLKQRLCELATTAYDRDNHLVKSRLSEYSQLGDGCTRRVYEIEHEGKTYAVKFALEDAHRRNNRREARWWRTFRATTRKMMAEVHGISTCGRVLAMEPVESTLQDSKFFNQICDWNEALRDQLEKGEALTRNETYSLTHDNASFNVGVMANGDIVWIDYAQALCR